jgi:hypothetical protein
MTELNEWQEIQAIIEQYNNNTMLEIYDKVEIPYTRITDRQIEILKKMEQYRLTAMGNSIIIMKMPFKK